jgi:hypothetical protein
MLILGITSSMLSCSSPPATRLERAQSAIGALQARIPDVVNEGVRAGQIRIHLDRINGIIEQLSLLEDDHRATLLALSADPMTSHAALESAGKPFDARRAGLLAEILDERDELIHLTTPGEWAALSAPN